MNIFTKRKGYGEIVAIPEDIIKDIEKLINIAPSYLDPERDLQVMDVVARLETFIRDCKAIEAEDDAKESIIDALTDDQEEKLKEAHMKDYHGDKDHWEDSYSSFLENITSTELKSILYPSETEE